MNFVTYLLIISSCLSQQVSPIPSTSPNGHVSSSLLSLREEEELPNFDLYKCFVRGSYFSNLNYNFDYNYHTYCNYIALEQVLCFYDTYLNDTIIPEGYDVPGYYTSIHQSENSVELFDTNQYGSPGVGASYGYTNLQQQQINEYNANNYLELLLGHSVNFNLAAPTTSFVGEFGHAMLRVGLSNSFTLVHFIDSAILNDPTLDITNIFLSNFFEGYPIVVEIGTGATQRHTVTVCGTDGTNIYYNNGYSERKNDDKPTLGQCPISNIVFAYSVKPTSSLTHVCSDNYRIVNAGVETSICPCMLQGYNYFPDHIHQITTGNGTHHLETCPSTNQSRYVPHTFSQPFNIDPQGHAVECIYCGEEEHENHSIDSYTNITTDGHTTIFDDGCQLNQAHSISNIECYGNAVHKLTCPCSAYGLEYHYPCLFVVDGVVYTNYFDGIEVIDIDLPELENQDDGWVCLCGYSNTMSVNANTQNAIIEYFLERLNS